MDILDKAIIFAVNAHSGMVRKDGATPYILHPLEVAAIAGSMTDDREVLAAAVLHDVVEDTEITSEKIENEFGSRVAALVASETEDKRKGVDPAQSWLDRKKESLAVLKNSSDPAVKIIWISDKLSNVRSFYRSWLKCCDKLWDNFNQKDTEKQAWYYRSVAEYTAELKETSAWQEYAALINKIFKESK